MHGRVADLVENVEYSRERLQDDTPVAESTAEGAVCAPVQAQRLLLECALKGEGVAAVLNLAVSPVVRAVSARHDIAVLATLGERTHSDASAGFPADLLGRLLAAGSVAASAKLAREVKRGAARLWVEPILTDRDEPVGVLVVAGQALRSADACGKQAASDLAASVGIALRVADRESSSKSVDEALKSLTSVIPGVVYQRVVRPDGDIRYSYISESAYDLFGVSATQILNDPAILFDRYTPDYRASFRRRLLEASKALTTWDVEASILMPDGSQKFTHAIARPRRNEDGSVVWTGVILDATRIKKAEAAVAAADARTREAIVESLSQGFLLFDADDRLSICNSHYRALYPALDGIVTLGARYEDVVRAEVHYGLATAGADWQRCEELALRLSSHGAGHHVFERQLSAERWILVNEHRTAEGGTVILYTDVTDLKLRERRIQHIAHHDSLTDLPNRTLFRHQLEEALVRARRSDRPVALFCLDLDHFKHVNDTLGHPAGDVLLKVVGDRLQGCLRETDTAARLGGDEFAVIVPDLPHPEFATTLAWRLLDAIAAPIDIDGHQVVTAASVGVVISGRDIDDADRLMKSADLALYRAKSDGRNTFRYFEPEMDAKAQARRALEMDLRLAIARDQMEVHYQPVVDVFTDEIVAFEALVRWTHPERGRVPPLEFIGLAEETGLIKQLGEWILRRACSVAVSWPNSIRIAVNLSPAQFRDRELADAVFAILQETGLPPTRLELEITESLLLRDTDTNLAILHRFKDAGIRISMDDFGTGYSSLGNLRSFPFDKIKVDQSFVRDLERNPDSAAIVRAVLNLGRSLGMRTVAEGVETREQLSRLRAEGCSEIQGFYYSKPQPAAEIEAMLSGSLRRQGPKMARIERERPSRKSKFVKADRPSSK